MAKYNLPQVEHTVIRKDLMHALREAESLFRHAASLYYEFVAEFDEGDLFVDIMDWAQMRIEKIESLINKILAQ